MILIYVPFPTLKSAIKTSETLLRNKKIACANIFKVNSVFEWNGKIRRVIEYLAIMKAKSYEETKKEIEKLHPYKIPAIIKINCKANEKFEKWLDDVIK